MKNKTKNLIKNLRESIGDLHELLDKHEKSYTYQKIVSLKKALSNADQRNIVSIKKIDNLEERVKKCNKSESDIIENLEKSNVLLKGMVKHQGDYIEEITWWKLLLGIFLPGIVVTVKNEQNTNS